MKYGVPDKDMEQIKTAILKHQGSSQNLRLYIYGSRVKGNARPFSDIDLLLLADSYDEESLAKIDFEELDIPFKVDLVLEPNLFEPYREEIQSHMQQII